MRRMSKTRMMAIMVVMGMMTVMVLVPGEDGVQKLETHSCDGLGLDHD